MATRSPNIIKAIFKRYVISPFCLSDMYIFDNSQVLQKNRELSPYE